MDELGRQSLSEFKKADKISVVVVLDDVRSLHNVGSVFRTADAFSIEKIVLGGITACPPHREIEKTALGATESVTWEHVSDIKEEVQKLKSAGYIICGVEQVNGSSKLHEYEIESKKIVVVFGNEVKGVSQEVLNLCDQFIEIPQSGTKHSLNISVSAGIVLWELYRQLKA